MNVLSLFDGMSCGQIALERAGVKIGYYFASEIDKYAIKVTQDNFPNTVQLGDITQLDVRSLPKIDLLIGGSPCQGFSFAGKQLNFKDPRSKLFFDYVEILGQVRKANPNVKFILENVRMKKEFLSVISERLGVEPVMINSNLVSAQNRKRYYWTNICHIKQPEDRGILLEDIVEQDALVDAEKAHAIIGSIGRTTHREYFKKNQGQMVYKAIMLSNIYGGFKEKKPRIHLDKSVTIRTASGGGHLPSLVINGIKKTFSLEEFKSFIRKVTPMECERLQTVPEGYTEGVSNTQRYKMLGNGWTVDVIAHILKKLNEV